MAKAKGSTARRKPRARPITARKRSKRATAPARKPSPMREIVSENDSEDQAGAYGDDRGETDLIQP